MDKEDMALKLFPELAQAQIPQDGSNTEDDEYDTMSEDSTEKRTHDFYRAVISERRGRMGDQGAVTVREEDAEEKGLEEMVSEEAPGVPAANGIDLTQAKLCEISTQAIMRYKKPLEFDESEKLLLSAAESNIIYLRPDLQTLRLISFRSSKGSIVKHNFSKIEVEKFRGLSKSNAEVRKMMGEIRVVGLKLLGENIIAVVYEIGVLQLYNIHKWETECILRVKLPYFGKEIRDSERVKLFIENREKFKNFYSDVLVHRLNTNNSSRISVAVASGSEVFCFKLDADSSSIDSAETEKNFGENIRERCSKFKNFQTNGLSVIGMVSERDKVRVFLKNSQNQKLFCSLVDLTKTNDSNWDLKPLESVIDNVGSFKNSSSVVGSNLIALLGKKGAKQTLNLIHFVSGSVNNSSIPLQGTTAEILSWCSGNHLYGMDDVVFFACFCLKIENNPDLSILLVVQKSTFEVEYKLLNIEAGESVMSSSLVHSEPNRQFSLFILDGSQVKLFRITFALILDSMESIQVESDEIVKAIKPQEPVKVLRSRSENDGASKQVKKEMNLPLSPMSISSQGTDLKFKRIKILKKGETLASLSADMEEPKPKTENSKESLLKEKRQNDVSGPPSSFKTNIDSFENSKMSSLKSRDVSTASKSKPDESMKSNAEILKAISELKTLIKENKTDQNKEGLDLNLLVKDRLVPALMTGLNGIGNQFSEFLDKKITPKLKDSASKADQDELKLSVDKLCLDVSSVKEELAEIKSMIADLQSTMKKPVSPQTPRTLGDKGDNRSHKISINEFEEELLLEEDNRPRRPPGFDTSLQTQSSLFSHPSRVQYPVYHEMDERRDSYTQQMQNQHMGRDLYYQQRDFSRNPSFHQQSSQRGGYENLRKPMRFTGPNSFVIEDHIEYGDINRALHVMFEESDKHVLLRNVMNMVECLKTTGTSADSVLYQVNQGNILRMFQGLTLAFKAFEGMYREFPDKSLELSMDFILSTATILNQKDTQNGSDVHRVTNSLLLALGSLFDKLSGSGYKLSKEILHKKALASLVLNALLGQG